MEDAGDSTSGFTGPFNPDVIKNIINSSMGVLQENLLNQVESIVTSKMEDLQKQVADKQENLAEEQLQKFKALQGSEHKFKRRGNEVQYKLNLQVKSKIESATCQLNRDSISEDNIKQAVASLSEGTQLLADRQKLILLADSSELGWRVVDEYESHEIAENSDDEKKIRRATFQAERKAKVQIKKKHVPRFSPYNASSRLSTQPRYTAPAAPQQHFSLGATSAAHFRPKPG